MEQSSDRQQALNLLRWLWLGYGVFVVYGSLVPLDFRPMPLEQAWQAFLRIPYLHLGAASRADWVANGVLYLPLGLLGASALAGPAVRGGALAAAAMAFAMATALAFGVEFTQLFFPPRTVSQNDLMAEALGSLLGALAALRLRPWLMRLLGHWQRGGLDLGGQLLAGYGLGYVLLCLFPYDFIVSAQELVTKLSSPLCAWWLAGADARWGLRLLSLAMELVLAMPYGFLLGRRPNGRWLSLGQAGLLGLGLGVLIESLQLLTVSGVSQGASLLSRAAGTMLGLQCWRRRSVLGERAELLARLRGWRWPFLGIYAALLLLVNGWFSLPRQGLAGAAATWSGLHWLPFYYHYYTTEAHALYSLGTVVLMYLPLTLLSWLQHWPRWRGLAVVGMVCLLMEASKLFLVGAHPDPSNVWLVLLSGLLGWRVLARLSAPPVQAMDRIVPLTEPGERLWRPNGRGLLAVVCALACALLAWQYPLASPLSLLLSLLVAGLSWRYWTQWPFVLPGLVPLLGFAPWTGWFSFEEMDLLVLATAAGAYARWSGQPRDAAKASPWQRTLRWGGFGRLLIGLFSLSLLLALWRGLQQAGGLEFGWYQGYMGPMNSLRQAKGFVWALLLLPLFAAAVARRPAHLARWLGLMPLLTLAGCGLFTLWERVAYTGLLNFSADYRVTGQFWEMHVGGATLDGFIALTLPFAVAGLLRERRPWHFGGLLLLSLLGAHAALITFSRGVYLAVPLGLALCLGLMLAERRAALTLRPARAAVLALLLAGHGVAGWQVFGGRDYGALAGLLVSAALLMAAAALPGRRARLLALPVWLLSLAWAAGAAMSAALVLAALGTAHLLLPQLQRPAGPSWRGGALWLGLLLGGLAVLAALAGGGYIAQRAATVDRDWQGRLAHWRQVLDLMSEPGDEWLGRGTGRFVPSFYLAGPQAERIGDYRLVPGSDGPVLQLRAGLHGQDWGAMQRVTQRIARPQGPLRLQMRVRATQDLELQIEVCERHLIYAFNCQIKGVMVTSRPGAWQDLDVALGPSPPRGDTRLAPRRVAFSMALRTRGALAEIASVQLIDASGPLLKNGDFAQDLAHWFFSSDLHHMPWHIKNMALHIFFEQGGLGLALVGLMLLAALWRCSVGEGRGHPLAAPLLGGLLGLLVVGLFDSLIDAPRLSFMFYLLLMLGLGLRAPQQQAPAPLRREASR